MDKRWVQRVRMGWLVLHPACRLIFYAVLTLYLLSIVDMNEG